MDFSLLNFPLILFFFKDVEFKIWKKNASFTPIPTEIETEDEKGCMSSFFCCCQGVTQGKEKRGNEYFIFFLTKYS